MSQGTHGRAERSPSINRETKVFNDPIHGHIELDHIFMNVIDTPEFQRLRNLKQLGAVNFVYPGAVHTRFEHSIGTCYLALRLVRHLREAQPYLGITNEEEICVALAGLCHDLGHGPFSHTFDKILIPQSKHEGYENWSHELGSIKIFDSMVERYDLIEVFRGYGYHLTTEDIHFVKEMIYGPLDVDNPEYKEPDDGEYQAKDPDKHFLYEIISNKTNEIDVDKWDYFARDSYHLGVRFTFQHDRFIKFSKVLNVSEKGPRKTQICFRDKEAINVYQMFHTRFTLYRMACYHPITVGMEAMITDALLAAAKHLTFTKRNGSTFKLQDAISDMDAYQQLDDNILTLILHSNVDNLKEARQILERVRKRDIYKCVDRIPVKEDKDPEQEDTIREDIVQCEANEGLLKADDLLVQIIKIDYGMKDKNPVDCVLFFSKEDPDKPKSIRQDEVSHLLPKTFQERQVFIFVKNASKRYRDRAKKCVAEWRKKTSWVQQKVGTDIPTVKSMSEGSESRIRETKVFQDPIHGSIELDPVYMKVIDTPEFQRLRNLKHLGAVNFVYPGAIHTRFEHSIGTCHIALRLVRHLDETQPHLGITKEEIFCVSLAALCHDLGCRPFSNVFNQCSRLQPEEDGNWSHKLGSIKIFDHMVNTYGLVKVFRDHGYKIEDPDIHFVKEMIYGPLKIGTSGYHEATDNKYKAKYGRRYFLYEIVSNSINQIDVNKWDHLARDSYHLGVPCSFIHDRLLKFTKVLKDRKDQQKTHIGFRDKEASSVLEMFHTKYKLFRMARYHPVTIGMEAMIADALSAAVDHIKLTKSDGSTVSIPNAVTDMDAYRQLDDNILTLILHSYSNENLKESRQILERMQRRDIYKCIKRIPVKRGANEHEDEIRTEIVAGIANEGHLKANDLYVKVIELDYGMKDRNPLDSVLFFSKDKPDEPKSFWELQEQVSLLVPQKFEERLLFIYMKDAKDKENRRVAVECIDQWEMKSPWVEKEHEDVGSAKTPQNVKTPTTPPPASQKTGMPRPPSKRRGPPGENDEPEVAKKKLFSESE